MMKAIAMIDDDPDDLAFYKGIFAEKDSDLQVIQYTNGETFLQEYENSKKSVPRLIMVDLNMPRVSGLELIKMLKDHDRLSQVPVVVLTTSSSPLDIQDCVEEGIKSYFIKPLHYEDCKKLVSSIYEYWFIHNKALAV